MNHLLLSVAFLFLSWRVLAPTEPQVPPALEEAAISIVREEAPSPPRMWPITAGPS
jgi:hypothetical protein